VISKIIQAQRDKIFATMAQQPWTGDAITNDGGDPTRLVRTFINFNNKHQGGVMRYVDEYYVKFALPSILDSKVTIPSREFVDLMLTYAKQRGKPWPEMMALMMQILRKAANSADLSSNVELKSINRLVAQLDTVVGPVGNNPELEQFKAEMISALKNNQTKQNQSNPYTQKQLTDESFLREFSESVESEELVWHRDRCDRVVKVIEGTGWKFQLDNKLPQKIKAGDTFTIPAKTYHRIHKGTSKLVVEIIEYR
jgi:quercetin dioxygenase-like cupin family protein